MWWLAAIGLGVLAYCLISGRLHNTMITPPMVFALFGLAIGTVGLDLLDMKVSHDLIHTLAEITLALVLFSDAARIDVRLLARDHDLPMRMLAIGMPLTILFGTLAALALPLGLGIFEAALLAAILAPTDAALGQAVVSSRLVPVRIRQALNVESGLNDGIALPFVYLFAALMTMNAAAGDTASLALFTLKQLTLGPLVGVGVGIIIGYLAVRANRSGWMDLVFEGPMVLATVALAFAGADAVGGNSFIAVFVAGLTFGRMLDGKCKFILEFAEAEGQMLILIAFMLFGAVMLPELIGHVTWPMLAYAALSLTVIRMLPVALSLLGTGVGLASIGFLGWFGPRGLASILFGLLVLERFHSETVSTILAIVTLTVLISVFAHGMTAVPFARWYGRMTAKQGLCPEKQDVSEIPLRTNNAIQS
ncbi:MAG: cation:proton antiporter [Pseudomonadota bacterium]